MEKTQQQLSQPLLSLPKFQSADEFTRLTLGIKKEKMDSIISFTDGETVSIVGDIKYSQILLTRLCVRALTPIRHGGCGFSNVIIIDAGNSSDIYQYVNFAHLSIVNSLRFYPFLLQRFEQDCCNQDLRGFRKLQKMRLDSI